MAGRYLTLFLLAAFCSFTANSQGSIETYTDRASFLAASRDVTMHDFEGIVPNSGFKHYQREGLLRYAGFEFRPGGGGRFGGGAMIVVGGWYQAGPAYETTTGAKLHWGPPNQPGNAYLEITLQRGATAVGADLWAVQPVRSSVEVIVTTDDGQSLTKTIDTPARPSPAFVGFTATSPIASIRLKPPAGQTGLIVDNLAVGKSLNRGATRPPEAAAAVVEKVDAAEGTAPKNPSSPARVGNTDRRSEAAPAAAVASRSEAGVIAYVRDSKEIRLINPDGSGDRRLWTHPDLNDQLGIFELAWKRDGSELAFSSAHEGLTSPYIADIYSIKRDGSNVRRLTNPPDRAGLGRLPKGSVTVKVSNFQAASETPGNFIFYIAGADEPQQVFIPAGTSKVVTFTSVADFGRQPQTIVAISGRYRWFVPGPDVVAGRNVTAPMFPISGPGFELHGAFRPVWRADGSRVSYRSGLCIVSSAPAVPVLGSAGYNPFFAGKNPMGTCAWDWGPTPALASQVIYTENSSGSNIYQMTEGGAHPGTKVTAFSDLDYQLVNDLHWLPDGSGLLYSTVNLYRDSSNIFRYDFATKKTTPVTRLEKEFARAFSVSPDSRTVVYERCTTREEDRGCDLWTVGSNGAGARVLVRNGQRPAWGK